MYFLFLLFSNQKNFLLCFQACNRNSKQKIFTPKVPKKTQEKHATVYVSLRLKDQIDESAGRACKLTRSMVRFAHTTAAQCCSLRQARERWHKCEQLCTPPVFLKETIGRERIRRSRTSHSILQPKVAQNGCVFLSFFGSVWGK